MAETKTAYSLDLMAVIRHLWEKVLYGHNEQKCLKGLIVTVRVFKKIVILFKFKLKVFCKMEVARKLQ